MRTKKLLFNSITSAILSIFTLLIGLILPRMVIQTYGSEINGLVSSIVQFVSYFSYVEAGLGKALIYALFKPLAERDIPEVNGIVSLAKKSYIKASGLYFLLVVCLSLVYPFLIQTESIDTITICLLVFVIGLFGSLDFYMMAKYQVLLIADQKEYVISLVSIFALLVNFTLMVLLIRNHWDIVLVRVVPLVSLMIRSFLLFTYVKYKYPFIQYNAPPNALHLRRRWDALILQLSVSLNFSVPVVVISIFCSLEMVSVYSIYSMVFSGLIAIISVFTAGVSASFGNLVAKKELTVLKKAHAQFEFLIYAITAFLYSCALILINPFISVYTRGIADINYVYPIYGVLLVIWGILHNVRIPYTALVNASGLYRETSKVNILSVVLLVVLSLILVQFLGIPGVLIALIIAAFYRGVDLILVVKPLVVCESIRTTFMRILRMYSVVVVTSLPFLLWIPLTASNLYEWLIMAIGVAGWCGAITILFNFLFERKVFFDTVHRIEGLMDYRHK